MKSNIFIHLGYPKTASTLLQGYVFPYFEGLTFSGHPYTTASDSWNKLQYCDDSLFDIEEARKDFESVYNQPSLISSEMLVGNILAVQGINRSMVANRLKEVFGDPVILIFIRNQTDMLRSLYNENIKTVGISKPEDYIRFPKAEYTYEEYLKVSKDPLKALRTRGLKEHGYMKPFDRIVHPDVFKYYEAIRSYRSLFSQVHVLLFEDFVSDIRSGISKLETITGRNFTGSYEFDQVNPSLSDREVKWLRIINKLNAIHYGTKAMFARMARKFPSKKKFDFNEDLKLKIRDYYFSDNQLLDRDYPEIGLMQYADKYFLN